MSLRTVQRIEKGTEEISGFSLRQISNVLDIPLEQLIMQNVDQISIDSNQIGSIQNLYFSSLTFILNPLLGFVVPLIIGLTKSNKNHLYKENFRFILLLHGVQFLLFLAVLPVFVFGGSTYSETTTTSVPGTSMMNTTTISSANHPLYDNPIYMFIPIILYYIVNIAVVLVKVRKLRKISIV